MEIGPRTGNSAGVKMVMHELGEGASNSRARMVILSPWVHSLKAHAMYNVSMTAGRAGVRTDLHELDK